MSHQLLANHLIEQYRRLVGQRYRYKPLQEKFGLPATVREDKVDAIREYFLDYIYPDSATRSILNAAFEHLDDHFKNPGHLIQLVGDASGVLFKFGFQFPKALKAGMNALSSFKAASKFEQGLLDAAIMQDMVPPITEDQFLQLIATLPKKQVTDFIGDLDDLLSALMDIPLMEKTVGILEELLLQMRKHPKVYTALDIKGMEIGKSILDEGVKLFRTMPKSERHAMIELIVKAETYFISEIYRTKGKSSI